MLFVTPGAPQGRWLRIVLAEKEVERAQVETIVPGVANEDFMVVNPDGVLPALADRAGVINGATTIAEYLDERYPHPPLMPSGPALRAQARMLLRQFDTVLFPVLAELAPRRTLPGIFSRALCDFGLRVAGRGTAQQGVCGPGYTFVDSALAVMLWRLRELRITVPSCGPGFDRYARRLLERPAVVRGLQT